jgi:hypothetical protein
MKTQEELLEELLDEVRQTRRYAEAMRQSSERIIDIVSTVFDVDGKDITAKREETSRDQSRQDSTS